MSNEKSAPTSEGFECIGYMKSIEGNDEFCMFVNENSRGSDGGFKWAFLDYKPDDIENYRKIYIYLEPQGQASRNIRLPSLEMINEFFLDKKRIGFDERGLKQIHEWLTEQVIATNKGALNDGSGE